MRLFGFVVKPDWHHADPARRAAAVAKETSPELIAALPGIARDDADPRVRIAALGRLDDASLLRTLRAGERDAAVREALDARLLRLALAADEPPDEAAVAWIDTLPASTRIRVVRDAASAAWRRAAIAGIDRPALIAERCLADPDPALRLELVNRLEDPEVLERIAQKARRDDKRVARAAADRAQAIRLAAGDPAALRAAALAVGERLAALRREPTETLASGLESCESAWRELAPRIDATTFTIVQGHFAQARAALDRMRGVSTPTKSASADADTAASDGATTDHEADPEVEADVDPLQKLVEACEARIDEVDRESLEGLLAGFEEAWRALPAHGPRARAIRERFDRVAAKARQRLDDASRAHEAQRRERETALRHALGVLESALDEGSVTAARTALGSLDAVLAALGEVPRDLRRREATARQGLATLVARQRWSLNRQRAELVDSAAALPGQGLHPDAVAARVRELREAWARLDAIASAAGDAPDPESGLARRFRALTGKALAPTRKYFAERQKLRAARATEFAALAAPIELAQADDRTLALRRRAVASALRRLDEVDPSRRGEIGRRLREALARLDASRHERAASAAAARRRLLANLARRLARADLATAVAAAREAESEWSRLPRAHPELERTLRGEFDALVGPWFERERAGRAKAAAAHEAALTEAEAIVVELESLGQTDGGSADLEHRIHALRRRWQALEDAHRPPRAASAERGRRDHDERPAPRGERPSPLPTRRFDAALGKAEAARRTALAREAAEARTRRLALIEAMRAIEAEADRVARGLAPPGPRSTIDLPAPIGDASALSPMLLARRDAALAVLEGHGDVGAWIERVEAATRQAIELALRAECCAGVESPAAEIAARRRIQVARLEDRLRGGAALDPQAEMRAIEDAWHALGPVDTSTARTVEARISRAAAAVHGQTA